MVYIYIVEKYTHQSIQNWTDYYKKENMEKDDKKDSKSMSRGGEKVLTRWAFDWKTPEGY